MELQVAYSVRRYRGLKTPLYGEIKNLERLKPVVLTEVVGKWVLRSSKLKIFSSSSVPWWRFRYRDRHGFFRDVMLKNQIRLVRAYMADSGIRIWPLCEQLNLPLITSFHGLDVSTWPRWPPYLRNLRQLFEKGRIFLVRSNAMRDDVVNLGCPADKVRVLYGGIDTEEFRFRNRSESQNTRLRILMCGRLIEKKGFAYGMKAFARLRKKHTNIELRIVGGGPLRLNLKLLTKILHLGEKVSFSGEKEPKDIPEEMWNAQIFLAPSVTSRSGNKEGIPNVIKEAMATGLPVVSTRHAGIPELVIDGKTGFLVPEKDVNGLADRLGYLIAHPEIWDDLGRQGRKVVEEKFNLFKQVRKLEKIYQGVIDEDFGRLKVSIVIPTHNRKKILAKTLDCLMLQGYPNNQYEIIVVDDGSRDGTKEMVKSKTRPEIVLRYFYQKQRGPHFARNLGIKKARGEIVIFVDSDIFAPPNFILEHVKSHEALGDVVVSGPTVRTGNVDNVFANINRRKTKKLLFDFSGPSLITANLSVKRRFLIRVGGFDEEFIGYGWHDWELGLRLKKLGLKVKRNINALAYHYKRKTNLSDLPSLREKGRQRGRNAVLYYKKHPNLRVKFGIRPQSLIFDRLIGWIDKDFGEMLILRAANKGSRWQLRLLMNWKLLHAYAEGLRDGMRKHKVRLF